MVILPILEQASETESTILRCWLAVLFVARLRGLARWRRLQLALINSSPEIFGVQNPCPYDHRFYRFAIDLWRLELARPHQSVGALCSPRSLSVGRAFLDIGSFQHYIQCQVEDDIDIFNP